MISIIKNLTLATVAFAAFTGTAMAGPTAGSLPSVEVNAAGYDLASPQGIASLTSKARSAAKQLCGVNQNRDLGLAIEASRCFNRAVADANRQIEALRLIRMAGRSGEQVAIVDAGKLPHTK
jgi:UrcA family protein